MKNEVFARMPEMIQALLDKVEKHSLARTSKTSEAKDLLIKKLRNITSNISNMAKEDGEKLTEEQKKIISDLQIPIPMPWILPGGDK